MQVVCSKLFECCSFRKDLCTLFGVFERFLFRSRCTCKVVASTSCRIRCNHRSLGMQVVCSKLFECCSFRKDLCTLFGVFERFLFRSRCTCKVVASKSFGISMNWSLRMQKNISKVLEVASIVKDTNAFSNELVVLCCLDVPL